MSDLRERVLKTMFDSERHGLTADQIADRIIAEIVAPLKSVVQMLEEDAVQTAKALAAEREKVAKLREAIAYAIKYEHHSRTLRKALSDTADAHLAGEEKDAT